MLAACKRVTEGASSPDTCMEVLGSLVVRPDPITAPAATVVMAAEITTVADDEIVVHFPAEPVPGPENGSGDPPRLSRMTGLEPGSNYEVEGLATQTLPRPGGERLATFATVNDLHFGEVDCGVIEGLDLGPALSAAPGEPPYPQTMNRAAVSEIASVGPDAVLAKGDLTDRSRPEEFQAFLDCYQGAFGDRLHFIAGNHDVGGAEHDMRVFIGAEQSAPSPGQTGSAAPGQTGWAVQTHVPTLARAMFAGTAPREVVLPGVVLALLDTTIPGKATGALDAGQLAWLDELAARADRAVLVFGHHHVWNPESRTRAETYFGINPSDSEALIDVVARRPSISGYFAGHTHRNRVRRFAHTTEVPWVEVSCVKDYPGSWAEYRVFEGGILQVHRRISAPEALAWSERTRTMFGGLYPQYSFGTLADRCLAVWPRRV